MSERHGEALTLGETRDRGGVEPVAAPVFGEAALDELRRCRGDEKRGFVVHDVALEVSSAGVPESAVPVLRRGRQNSGRALSMSRRGDRREAGQRFGAFLRSGASNARRPTAPGRSPWDNANRVSPPRRRWRPCAGPRPMVGVNAVDRPHAAHESLVAPRRSRPPPVAQRLRASTWLTRTRRRRVAVVLAPRRRRGPRRTEGARARPRRLRGGQRAPRGLVARRH